MADVAAGRAAAQGASHPDTLQAEQTLSAMTSDENARFGLKRNTRITDNCRRMFSPPVIEDCRSDLQAATGTSCGQGSFMF
jgi:hypothetical protein